MSGQGERSLDYMTWSELLEAAHALSDRLAVATDALREIIELAESLHGARPMTGRAKSLSTIAHVARAAWGVVTTTDSGLAAAREEKPRIIGWAYDAHGTWKAPLVAADGEQEA